MTFFEEFSNVISEETKILKELLVIAEEKSEILVGGKVSELELLTKREEILTNRMQRLEKEREVLLTERGLSKDTTLIEILEGIDEENSSFIGLASDLIDTVRELTVLNDQNKELLDENLLWVEFNLNVLSKAQVPSSYGKGTEQDELQGTRVFDQKA